MINVYLIIRNNANRILKILDISFLIVGLMAVASLVTQYGFYVSAELERWLERFDLIIVFYYVIQFTLRLLLVRQVVEFIKRHWFESLIVLIIVVRTVFIISRIGFSGIEDYFLQINYVAITKFTIVGAQILIILSLISASLRINRKIAALRFHPSQTLLISFLLVILLGTALLLLPRASRPGESTDFVTALFTSTSATCVTGLIVVDTAGHFSLTGQLIILMLIQIGGLGIMTLSSFLAMFFGQGIAIKERVMLQEMMNIERLGVITSTLRMAIVLTMIIEGVGALLLFLFWNQPSWTLGERIYHSIFHSVSAFCNAGFSLNADSLMQYDHNYSVLFIISMLIIAGGLGFVVLMEIGNPGRIKNLLQTRSVRRFSVHTKLVFILTVLLLVSGTVIEYLLDQRTGHGWYRFMQAFFLSVTSRTAGFNSSDVALLSSSQIFFVLILMFIGASPGSTGGGVKTTTIGILFGSISSIIRGKYRVQMFRKTISYTVVNRALVVFAFSISMITLLSFLLSLTESGVEFLDLIFEEISAFGTVGLSRGITAGLSSLGKAVIILSMFIGRVGVLTLAFAITPPREKMAIEYPRARNIMVG